MIRLGFRAAVVAVGVLGLAACEAEPRYPISGEGGVLGSGGVSVAQPRYPITPNAAPSTSAPAFQPHTYALPPPTPSDEGAPPVAAPSSSIQTQALGAPGTPPPPPPAASPNPSPEPNIPSSEDADLRGRQPMNLPRARPAPPPALEIPSTVQVQPFETVYDLAERVRTPLRALIDLNHLRPPYALTAGMVLRVPSPVVYTVQDGDTLFGVARRFSIDPRSLANLNDLPLEVRLRRGQRLALPSLVHDKGANAGARGGRPEGLGEAAELSAAASFAHAPTKIVPATSAVGTAAVATTAAVEDHSASTVGEHMVGEHTATEHAGAERASAEPAPRMETPPTSDNQVLSLGRGRFNWPVKGEILSAYGPKGAGQRNDGVNIAASTGESVKAAAAGTVVYAGNSIPAFGNLVLIKHPGGWATLYGNLGKISVKNNAQVSQGEEVGTAGVSGAVDKPQVHFEIRYAPNPHDKAKPYDPASLLPGS